MCVAVRQLAAVVKSLGPFVRMIVLMCADILKFLTILSCFWVGFGRYDPSGADAILSAPSPCCVG